MEDGLFKGREHREYEYKGEKYILVECLEANNSKTLSNYEICNEGDKKWIKVEPIKWLIDTEDEIVLSNISLASGIKFIEYYDFDDFDIDDVDFKNTTIYFIRYSI